MYSGVLALGVGDSVAAVSGTLVGRHKWPGTSKTFEGTFMSVLCQLIVVAAIIYISECNGSVCPFISLSLSLQIVLFLLSLTTPGWCWAPAY